MGLGLGFGFGAHRLEVVGVVEVVDDDVRGVDVELLRRAVQAEHVRLVGLAQHALGEGEGEGSRQGKG